MTPVTRVETSIHRRRKGPSVGRLMTVLALACTAISLVFLLGKIEWRVLPLRGIAVLPLLFAVVGIVLLRSVKRAHTGLTFFDRVVLWALYRLSGFFGFAVLFLWLLDAGLKLKALRYQCVDCSQNVQILVRAMQMYVADWDDRFPVANEWCDSLRGYVRPAIQELYPQYPADTLGHGGRPFVCPSAPEVRCGYALNSKLSAVKVNALDDPQDTIVFFESDAGWNGAGGPDLLTTRPRHVATSWVAGVGFQPPNSWMPRSRHQPAGSHEHRAREGSIRVDLYSFVDGRVEQLRRKKAGGFLGSLTLGWARQPDAYWVIWKPVLRKPEADPK